MKHTNWVIKKSLRDKNTEVVVEDLRALLFWASVGVKNSRGGSYASEIENIIESYCAYLGIKHAPKFKREK